MLFTRSGAGGWGSKEQQGLITDRGGGGATTSKLNMG